MYINPCFSRLFIQFSKTALPAQWILHQLESSINLHYWNFAIWSNFTIQVHIAGFLNSPVIYIYYSSNFKSNSTILKVLQSTCKLVFISQFVFVFIQCFHCGKLVNIYHILWIHFAWLFDVLIVLICSSAQLAQAFQLTKMYFIIMFSLYTVIV